MNLVVARRTSLSVFGAVLLSLTLASQVLAASWNAPMALTSSGIAFAKGLGTDGASTALALYMEHTPDMPDVGFAYRLKVRHSDNAGMSWDPPITLAESTINADIAMRGDIVDVVWDNGNGNRIRYARSFDGGMSFGPSVALSPTRKSAWNPSVARGPDGLVAVAWENLTTGVLKVRVSADGGDTFAPEINLANVAYDMGVEVAVGNGVIYVAYVEEDFNSLSMRRSTDEGSSWSLPIPITGNVYSVREMFSLAAAGSVAYIAYAIETGSGGGSDVKYRRSTDMGASWAVERSLSPVAWNSWEPNIELQGGVLRAVFTRRSPVTVFYRKSADGVTWSTSEKVADDAVEGMVGFAGKAIALIRSSAGPDNEVFVTTRTP